MLVLKVKRIIPRIQGIFQIPYTTIGMQLLPRSRARPAFTALECEQQAVESRCEGFYGPAAHCAVGVVDVVDLVGVILGISALICVKVRVNRRLTVMS
jgi:hypothetical protein